MDRRRVGKIWRGDGVSGNALREARPLAVGLWLYLQARNGMAVLVVKHFLEPVAFENDNHEDRKEKGDKQVGKAEDQQSCQHLTMWHLPHGADEEPFKNAQAAWRAGPERGAK